MQQTSRTRRSVLAVLTALALTGLTGVLLPARWAAAAAGPGLADARLLSATDDEVYTLTLTATGGGKTSNAVGSAGNQVLIVPKGTKVHLIVTPSPDVIAPDYITIVQETASTSGEPVLLQSCAKTMNTTCEVDLPYQGATRVLIRAYVEREKKATDKDTAAVCGGVPVGPPSNYLEVMWGSSTSGSSTQVVAPSPGAVPAGTAEAPQAFAKCTVRPRSKPAPLQPTKLTLTVNGVSATDSTTGRSRRFGTLKLTVGTPLTVRAVTDAPMPKGWHLFVHHNGERDPKTGGWLQVCQTQTATCSVTRPGLATPGGGDDVWANVAAPTYNALEVDISITWTKP